jgi:anaerobic ribonucleoside-triphosphate reductase activating protein
MFISAWPLSLTFQDYPKRDEWAILVYFQGCNRNCEGCHNTPLRSEIEGINISPDKLHKLLQSELSRFKTKNIVLTGGDPLMNRQLKDVRTFLQEYGNEYNICIYTGASKEEIFKKLGDIDTVKYYKGGSFVQEYKTTEHIGKTSTKFTLATTNQFILDGTFTELTHKGVLCYE